MPVIKDDTLGSPVNIRDMMTARWPGAKGRHPITKTYSSDMMTVSVRAHSQRVQ